jgi:hypothetical protein
MSTWAYAWPPTRTGTSIRSGSCRPGLPPHPRPARRPRSPRRCRPSRFPSRLFSPRFSPLASRRLRPSLSRIRPTRRAGLGRCRRLLRSRRRAARCRGRRSRTPCRRASWPLLRPSQAPWPRLPGPRPPHACRGRSERRSLCAVDCRLPGVWRRRRAPARRASPGRATCDPARQGAREWACRSSGRDPLGPRRATGSSGPWPLLRSRQLRARARLVAVLRHGDATRRRCAPPRVRVGHLSSRDGWRRAAARRPAPSRCETLVRAVSRSAAWAACRAATRLRRGCRSAQPDCSPRSSAASARRASRLELGAGRSLRHPFV